MGISHLSGDSKSIVKSLFKDFAPEILLLELDFDRYEFLEELLESPDFDINKVEIGAEYLTAISIIKRNNMNIPIFKIDKSTDELFKEIAEISLEELKNYENFCNESYFIDRKEVKNSNILNKLDNLNFIIDKQRSFMENCPKLYEIIINNRDRLLSQQIKRISSKYENKILVIVGIGHLPGILSILKRFGY